MVAVFFIDAQRLMVNDLHRRFILPLGLRRFPMNGNAQISAFDFPCAEGHGLTNVTHIHYFVRPKLGHVLKPAIEYKKQSQHHNGLCSAVDADCAAHIGRGQRPAVGADVGLVKELAEIIVRPAESAVEDAGKGGFRIAAVGRCVVLSVLPDKAQKP